MPLFADISGHYEVDTLSLDSIPESMQWVSHTIGRGVYVNIDEYISGEDIYSIPSQLIVFTHQCEPYFWEHDEFRGRLLIKNADTDSFVTPFWNREYFDTADPSQGSYEINSEGECIDTDTSTQIDYVYDQYLYEFEQVTNKKLHLILPAGNYILRYCYTVLPYLDDTNYTGEIVWQSWNHDGAEISFSLSQTYERDISQPQISLINYNDWENWLPTAPGFGSASGNDLQLSFQLNVGGIEADSLEYLVKFRVFDITWYPGTRTNSVDLNGLIRYDTNNMYAKYHQLISPTDTTTILDQDWDERLSWRASCDTVLNDFVIDSTSNPGYNITWNTGPADFGDTSVTQGYYELEWPNFVANGSFFNITYTPRDFGARCWTLPFIAFKDSSGDTTDWHPVTIYKRLNDGLEDYILPVPRDEEALEYIIKNGTRTKYGRGDRIADAWEENFVCQDSFMLQNTTIQELIRDSLTYYSIYELKPYYDDSHLDFTYFPDNSVSADSYDVSNVWIGDGLLNFEKYRGFYGMLDSTGNETYLRLNPSRRNIFLTPIDEIRTLSQEFNDSLHRGDNNQYFPSIWQKFVQGTGSDTNTIHLHTFHYIDNNIQINDIDQHFKVRRPPLGERPSNIYPSGTYPYVMNILTNNYLRTLPSHQNIVSLYNVIFSPVSQNMVDYYDNCTHLSSDVMHSTGISTLFPEYEYLGNFWVPIEAVCSITNINSMLIDPNARDSLTGSFDYPWIRKQISKTFAHELGHIIGLEHPDSLDTNKTIMRQGTFPTPPYEFYKEDFRTLFLTKYINYSILDSTRRSGR